MTRHRILLLVLAAMLALPGAAPAATVQVDTNLWFHHSDPPSEIILSVVERETIEGLETDTTHSACVDMWDENVGAYDSGCGVMSFSIDPAFTLGTLSGSIASSGGTIAVNMTIRGTGIPPQTNSMGELDPLAAQPQANLMVWTSRMARASGTIESDVFGIIQLEDVAGNISRMYQART